MTECNDSMYEWSIYGNRSTDFQILLMHSCSSITERVLYNDLITVSVPFLYPALAIASKIISRAFLDQLCFQALERFVPFFVLAFVMFIFGAIASRNFC